ncbi:MAG: MarR family transcriptional regulator [Candidatus Dormibacteria bacterium]
MTATASTAPARAGGRSSLIAATVGHVGALMRIRLERMTSRPCPRGLSLAQFWILMMLGEGRVATMRGIADALEVTPSSLTAIIDGLEQQALVARTRDSEDRRVVHIERTAEGERIVQEMYGLKQQQLRGVLERLSEAEVAGLERGLAAVIRVLETAELS